MLTYKNKIMRNFFIGLLLFPFFSDAQINNSESNENRFKLGIVPQYAITNGTRIDLDFQINDKHWLVVSPQMYLSSTDSWDWDYNSMGGAGVELQHKIFLTEETNRRSVYIAYGPTFNYFSVKDNGLVVQEFIENGGNYIGLVEDEMTTSIFKIGANLIFGIQFIISDRFYFDPYVGTGIRFSFDNHTSGLHNYYNEWWADMGYSGTLMVGGVRLGVIF